MIRAEGERTGVYFISRDPARSVFTYYRADSAASRLAPSDVPEAAVAAARALHVSGITQAISLTACDAAFHAMTVARAADTLVELRPQLPSPTLAAGARPRGGHPQRRALPTSPSPTSRKAAS